MFLTGGTPHNFRFHSRASVLRPSPFGGPTMFERLFDCPRVLVRQRAGPLLEERLRYLCYRADQGITRRILQETAGFLLVVAEVLRLADRPGEVISLSEVEQQALLYRRQGVRNKRLGSPRAA